MTLLVDRIVVATGFRPELGMLRELRVALDPVVEAPPALAPLIDPNLHSCGTVPPHGAAELAHPEPGFYIVGAKSYGRAPTFLMATGYEQVRSVVAEIAGDHVAAREVRLVLPETGVCTAPQVAAAVGCCGGPAPAEVDACCALDAEAKAEGRSAAGAPARPRSGLGVSGRPGRARRSPCCGPSPRSASSRSSPGVRPTICWRCSPVRSHEIPAGPMPRVIAGVSLGLLVAGAVADPGGTHDRGVRRPARSWRRARSCSLPGSRSWPWRRDCRSTWPPGCCSGPAWELASTTRPSRRSGGSTVRRRGARSPS